VGIKLGRQDVPQFPWPYDAAQYISDYLPTLSLFGRPYRIVDYLLLAGLV